MKKTNLLLSALALFSLSAVGQEKSEKEGLKFGLKAGTTLTRWSVSNLTDYKSTNIFTPSFYVGAVVDIPVMNVLSVQTGLSLINKSVSTFFYTNNMGHLTGQRIFSPMYLELPVTLVGKFAAGPGKILVGAGPYLSYNTGGKTMIDRNMKVGMTTYDATKKIIIEERDMPAMDLGLNFLLGYEFANNMSIQAGYGLGFSNLNSNNYSMAGVGNIYEKAKFTNNVIYLGIACSF